MAATFAQTPARGRPRALAAALFLATVLLFSRSVGNGFLDYDDPDYVTANPHVQAGLTWAGLRWAFTTGHAANWHPLTWLSHMADWQVFGENPAGHHATSVLIHGLNAALAFLALRRLTGATWAPVFAAALFAWHPLRVESVSWVAERKDVLSVCLGLLTLLAYGVYADRRRRGERGLLAYAGVFGALAAGLMCKPMLVTLPFGLLLLDHWPLRRMQTEEGRGGQPRGRTGTRRLSALLALVAEKIPLFILSAASCVVTYRAQESGNAMMVESQPLASRTANACVSVARYLGDMLWPAHLSIGYSLPMRWPAAAVGGSLLLIVGASGLAVAERRARPWIAVGWFWFLGTLVPVLGIVQVGMQAMADRYTYLPSLGLGLAGTWTAAQWASTGGRRRTAAGAAVLILGLCAAQTWRQQAVWRSPRTLYAHALALTPDNYITQGYLGSYLLNAHDPAGAEACFRRSIALRPDYGQARFRLGLALERQKRVDEAALVYSDLLRDRPYYTMAHDRLGEILMRRGDLPAAAEHLQAALQGMQTVGLLIDLGVVQSQLGRSSEAVPVFRQALALEPNNGNAIFGLAFSLEDLGRYAEALSYYRRSVGADPGAAVAWYGLGRVEARLGRSAEAVSALREALRLDPSLPGLSTALQGAGAGINRSATP